MLQHFSEMFQHFSLTFYIIFRQYFTNCCNIFKTNILEFFSVCGTDGGGESTGRPRPPCREAGLGRPSTAHGSGNGGEAYGSLMSRVEVTVACRRRAGRCSGARPSGGVGTCPHQGGRQAHGVGAEGARKVDAKVCRCSG
jgi:hypothetical protein